MPSTFTEENAVCSREDNKSTKADIIIFLSNTHMSCTCISLLKCDNLTKRGNYKNNLATVSGTVFYSGIDLFVKIFDICRPCLHFVLRFISDDLRSGQVKHRCLRLVKCISCDMTGEKVKKIPGVIDSSYAAAIIAAIIKLNFL